MFLSCLEIDSAGLAGRGWLAQEYRVHQRLRKAFPDGTEDVLYRLEPRHSPPRILVQSPQPGDWDACFEDLPVLTTVRQKEIAVLVAEAPSAGVAAEEEVPAVCLVEGRRFRFLLRANPTARRGPERAREGRTPQKTRVGLFREEEQRAWLERKGQQHGFSVIHFALRPLGTLEIRRPEGQGLMSFLAVEFEGLLEVNDPVNFAKSWEQGIGSGKAFGFGLLSLARAG